MLGSLGVNLRWGIQGGLFFAAIYIAWVTILFLVRGREPFDRLGVNLPVVVAVYLAGGVLSGAVIGLLRPFATRKVGAYLISIIAALPVLTGIAISLQGLPGRWDLATRLVVPFLSVAFGLALGDLLWKAASRNGRNDSRS